MDFLEILAVIISIVIDIFVSLEFLYVAKEKGYSSKKYFWWTFLLPPIGIMMVIALPHRKLEYKIDSMLPKKHNITANAGCQTKSNFKKESSNKSQINSNVKSTTISQNNFINENDNNSIRNYVKCPKCGGENDDHEIYCMICGTRLKK